jgi:phage-related protein
MVDLEHLKPLIWIGTSRRDLGAMPEKVKADFGYALYIAQQGDKHRNAKPLRGFGGGGVVEIVSDHRGDTFRCIYTLRLASAVYVLHVFQKKSKKGRATPNAEIELIKRRLHEAERIAMGERS